MAHHTDGSKTYVDTAFINMAGRIPGVSIEHMGFGEFYANTPKGRVDFDRMRGKEFPGQSGRSHQLYGEPQEAADWLVEEMEKKGKSEKLAAGKAAAQDPTLRSARIRLAASLPKGSPERKALLASLASSKVALVGEAKHRSNYIIQIDFASVKVSTESGGGISRDSEVWDVEGEAGIFPLTGMPYDFSGIMYVPPGSDRPYFSKWKTEAKGDASVWLMRAVEDLLAADGAHVVSLLRSKAPQE